MSAVGIIPNMTVAQAIKQWRKANGITQREVATAIGVTERTVARWEAGDYQARLAELKAMEKRWPGLLLKVMQ